MTTIQYAILVPLVAGLLFVGLGALVSRLAHGNDGHLPRSLWPIVGFAASIVLANSLSRLGVVTPVGPIIIVALAIGGLWLERRRLLPTPGEFGLAAIAAGPALLAFSGAILLAGPTITGYLVDTNTGIHSLGADFLLHSGGDFASIPRTSTDAAMVTQFFVDAVYPSGAHAIYGLLGTLTGGSLTFVASPFTGICLALTGLTAFSAARRIEIPPVAAALTGFLVSCGALVFAFGLTSEIKETVTLPLLAGMTAFAVDPAGLRRARAAIVVGSVLAAGIYSAIGVSSAAWAAPFVVFVIGRSQLFGEQRSVVGAIRALVLAGVLGLVLIGPLVPGLVDQFHLAQALSQTNAALASDPGNLFGPIQKVQALGIWIGPDHRFGPTSYTYTFGFIGITWLLIAAGVFGMFRERRWSAVLWLSGLFVLWYVLTDRGTLWLDSKLVMLSGLTLILVAAKGAFTIAERRDQPRVRLALGLALLAPVAAGVIASDYTLYESTTTASYDRYSELEAIDAKYRGQGAAYFSEFDEYAMYSLRHLHMTGVGYADGLPHPPAKGVGGFGYGNSVDTDRVDPAFINTFSLAITLRSPQRGQPGSGWDLVQSGRFFNVWKRDPARAERVVEHLPFGDRGAATGIATCEDVAKAAKAATAAGGSLVARVATAPTTTVTPKAGTMTPNWATSFSGSLTINGAGRLVLPVPASARGQERDLWLIGTVGRPLAVKKIGGERIGTLDRLAGGDGNAVGPVRVPAGVDSILIENTAPQARPGDKAPSALRGFVFAPVGPLAIQTVAPADYRSLCGKPVDWIDVVRG